VTRVAAASRAEQDVVRLCYRGLGVAELERQLLVSLRRLMSVDAAFVATADPDTLLLTGAFAEDPLGAATDQFLANEYGAADVNNFTSLAISPTHVATLDQATSGSRAESLRSRDIMGPLGLGDELRAALVTGSRCWGYLCLHREDRPLGFTSSEVAVVARLGPHIAHGMRQAVLVRQGREHGGPVGPGVIMLEEDGTVVAMTAEAQHMLSLLDENPTTARPLPVAIYSVVSQLGAIERRPSTSPTHPSARVQTVDGRWVRVHASRLGEPASQNRIVVVIELIDGAATVPLILSAYGLSPREAEVAALVLRGASTRTIVDTLHISQHTVQDHLKAVFDKTGVRSRPALIGQLLTQPTTNR
jgi:DNA-binding CsgD family transcriptional regulator